MNRVMEIAQLASMLNDQAEALAFHLFPAGQVEGPEFKIGSVQGEPGRSMSIRIKGDKRGVWRDFSADEGGDALDLIAKAVCGGRKGDAVRWAKQWLGLDNATPGSVVAPWRVAAPLNPRAEAADQKAELDKIRRLAQAKWLEGKPELRGTLVERYLKGRGIDLALLGRQPRALRFHPHLRYKQTEIYCPAMVAAIDSAAEGFISVHRTYLRVQPDGRVTKADVPEAKLTLGSYKGGAIRLWRGRKPDGSPRPALKDAEPGETVVLTEGIENGLTVALACPAHRVLAGISLSNLGAIALPDAVTSLIIVADNDQGAQAQAGLEKAIAAHARAGKRVQIARAPQEFKDVNDYAQALLKGERAA